jgi:rubredoxin-NAD+ reductase
MVASLAKRDDGGFVATLDDGATLHADKVLSATGLVPETALARSAGLRCNVGILVDRQLRTSDPHIHALGDCAETPAGYLPYILPIMSQARCLAEVLAGKDALLTMKAMPVLVKTTSLPVVVCPPRPGAAGTWSVEGSGRDLTAIFLSPEGKPLAFAVTGAAVKTQAALAAGMPPLLAG